MAAIVEKTIKVSWFDIKFRIDTYVYLNDAGKNATRIFFKSSERSNNNSLFCLLLQQTTTVGVHDVNDIKKIIQDFEQCSIDLINERISIEKHIQNVCNELSYVIPT